MYTAAKVLIIISMICGFIFIFPLIVGIIALNKMKTATVAKDLTGMAIVTLLFCNTISGILMLLFKDSDLPANATPPQA